MSFTPFDPLEFKNAKVTDAALGALKREIDGILSSYVGWFDPFCELIQNALDAVEARLAVEVAAGTQAGYVPFICVRIDLDKNALTVTDNGIGLDKEKFEQFLAPHFSFKTKTGKTRGHKGVGATYVAYGFNYMRVSTKSPGFSTSGRITGARTWLNSDASSGNPKVEPDPSMQAEGAFDAIDRGVSITVRFDETTHPKSLRWIKANTAEAWHKTLSIKSGLGSVIRDSAVHVRVAVIFNGAESTFEQTGTAYLWLHEQAPKKASIKAIHASKQKYFEKYGDSRLPDRFRHLDFVFETWTAAELRALLETQLDEEELQVLEKHTPVVSVEYGYTTKLWQRFNDSLGLRTGHRVLHTGIQMAANNMPQGEPIQVPLKRYTGRQNQVHFLIHFDNYTPDLGRKGFHRELSDFAKSVAQKLVEGQIAKVHVSMKANTGVPPDLKREMRIDEWKGEMVRHEAEHPLFLSSKHFFLPIERISITSVPTREQDVIALFHQLVAGGVIRGIQTMSTNERFVYDSLFRISFELEQKIYIYNTTHNPLGIAKDVLSELHGKVTPPRVLEFKYSLDGLVEDFGSNDKNIKDINLCVAWVTGSLYAEKYEIMSLLIPENVDQREYHGVTHVLLDIETRQKLCDLIILSELIEHLNDAEGTAEKQRIKYD